jgi:branched-chain amino acid aminotransferase
MSAPTTPTTPEYVYFEGQLVPFEQAKISVKTHSFLYGTSIFEGIRGYWLPEENTIAIFRMREHYQRLLANARICHLVPDLTVDELVDITVQLVQKNAPQTDTYIRPTLYKSDTSIGPALEKRTTAFTLWTHPLGDYVNTERGLSVCVSSWRRVDDNAIPPRVKAGGAYMNTALAITDAHLQGFDETIVLTHDGVVSEGSAMNLMIVRNGKLITPGKTDNILEGITRDAIKTLAEQELGLTFEERTIDRTELYIADEAFFCGTGAQVAPITKIDHRPLGNGEVGPIARQVRDLYFDVVRNKVPKYRHWITPVKIQAPVAV